jgi:hypothetical protein
LCARACVRVCVFDMPQCRFALQLMRARVCARVCASACACGMPRCLRASFLTCSTQATAEGRHHRRRTRPPPIHPRAHVCAARVATAASKEQGCRGSPTCPEPGLYHRTRLCHRAWRAHCSESSPMARPAESSVCPKRGSGARRAAAAPSLPSPLGEFPTARVLVGSRGAPRTDATIGPARNAPGCQPAAQRHARLGPMRSIRNWPGAAPARWGRRDRPAGTGPAWAHRAERDSAADG